jgi:trk system potassium uptake protein TrkH
VHPHLKIILRDLGSILIMLGLLMLVVLIVSLIFNEVPVMHVVVLTGSLTLCLGLVVRRSCRGAREPELKHAMITAAVAWLVVPAFSSLLFVFLEGMSPLDSLFEAMSGWTGTGLTMVAHPAALTHTIQFWRSFMQWVGGIGVIVLMVTILARPGTASFLLYKAETREEKLHPNVIHTVRIIWWIYLLLTGFGIALFYLAGMNLWEAINHAMTGLGTGGFSITDNSIAFYNNPRIELAIIPVMLLGAIPFLVHYKVLKGNIKALLSDIQCRALVLFILLLFIPLFMENYFTFYGSAMDSLRFSAFQLVSGITCTGFQTTDVRAWSGTALGIVSIAMLIGGAAGSTAGGIKVIKAVIAWKNVSWSLTRALLPRRGIKPFRFGGQLLDGDQVNKIVAEAHLVIILWVVFLFLGVGVLAHLLAPSYTLSEILFEVASAQGNVGLSTGITGAGMPWGGKVMLILNMWIGRLEIVPVLMLFRALLKGLEPI